VRVRGKIRSHARKVRVLANGLGDEIRFWLDPTVWGEGGGPFQGQKLRMRLLDATTYDSGVTLLRYELLDR
jgi:hypothetical protein